MSYHHGWIVRDGFKSAHGRFLTELGGMERIEGSRLKTLFLPVLTREANKLLRDNYSFVRDQLKHYDVQYTEKEFTGQGVLLLKKVLQAGKCDKVPDHIENLRIHMHAEWLQTQSPADLAPHPEFAMEKYFVDHTGKPDPTRTAEVIGFPLDVWSSYRSGQLREAVDKVPGLHHDTGYGPSTQTIYVGWDQRSVAAAAKHHDMRETGKQVEESRARDKERSDKHTKYLARSKNRAASLVGTYMIDCEAIGRDWPDRADDMTLSIKTTRIPGVYQAHCDFGVLEGVMMLSAEVAALAPYYDDAYASAEDDDDDHHGSATGSKRKSSNNSNRNGAPPPKAAKKAGNPTTYFLRMRSRETGEGVIDFIPEKGTITFDKADYSTFTGKVGMPCVGKDVPFRGRKISSTASKSSEKWEDFSEAAYEYARVARWH